jgi:hypothetical protein
MVASLLRTYAKCTQSNLEISPLSTLCVSPVVDESGFSLTAVRHIANGRCKNETGVVANLNLRMVATLGLTRVLRCKTVIIGGV